MYLTSDEISKADDIRNFILKTSNEELRLRCMCRKCKGTGLGKTFKLSGTNDHSWDGSSYCDFCKGIGYVNPKDIDVSLYMCCICNGKGFVKSNLVGESGHIFYDDCPNCNGFGFVTWLENLFGKKK